MQMPHFDDDSLRDASQKELRKVLGKSAHVYAPYILLRSFQQWRSRTTITLPDEIRPILEATYTDPIAAEPPAWRELREQLEKQKDKMARRALNATAIWNNPALPDEERIQTRYSAYPMAQLLLATKISPIGTHSVHLDLLNGGTVTADDRDWSFGAAKAIYRNLARVPYWAVAAGPTRTQGWLVNYVSKPAAAGLLQPDGSICWVGDEQQTGLSYHADQGVVINREQASLARLRGV